MSIDVTNDVTADAGRMDNLKQAIARQRQQLGEMLTVPLQRIADLCADAWPHRQKLNQALMVGLHELPYAQFLYVMDVHAYQISDNASHDGILTEHYGRDRSWRPYMAELVPSRDFILSEAYMSLRAHRPSVTAVQVIRQNDKVVGFLGVDFDLRDLPFTRELYEEPSHWRQIKGDPAIRSQVFTQKRVESPLDKHLRDVLPILEELIVDHGVFHCTLHFSSSRAVIWLVEDPYRYRLLDYEALVDPNVCFAYPCIDYPPNAAIPRELVRPILQGFRELRFADESLYLRAGSLNIFNGLVSLNFSCDGSHYMPYAEFLDKDVSFWGLPGHGDATPSGDVR